MNIFLQILVFEMIRTLHVISFVLLFVVLSTSATAKKGGTEVEKLRRCYKKKLNILMLMEDWISAPPIDIGLAALLCVLSIGEKESSATAIICDCIFGKMLILVTPCCTPVQVLWPRHWMWNHEEMLHSGEWGLNFYLGEVAV